MKTIRIVFTIMCFVSVPFVVMAIPASVTTNGTGGGAWSSTTTWADGVVPNGAIPIIIAATDSIIYDIPVTISSTLTKESSKKDSIAGGSVTFAAGSGYIHAVNGGSIPVATWETGSTCTLTGITSTVPANANQNFYNFSWIGTLMTGNLNLGWNNITIGGDVYFKGLFNRAMRLTNDTFGKEVTAPNIITINGNVTLGDTANVTGSGSGNNDHYLRVIIGGNLTATSGSPTSCMLQLANSSLCYSTWCVKGNVSFAACSLNTNNAYQDTLVFCGTTTQTLSCNVSMTKMAVVVYAGATLYMPDTSSMGAATNDFFILNSGATFVCGSTAGLSGNISCPLANTSLSTGADYAFVGTAAQVTSSLLPETVNGLEIDNNGGVTTSKGVTVTGSLHLKQGYLDDCAFPVVVLPGNIVWDGGSMCSVTGVEDMVGASPREFKLSGNFPNPFNPSTEMRFSVPTDGYTTLKVFNMLGQEVATLFEGVAKAGSYIPVTFNAAKIASGVYFARLEQNTKVMVQRMVLAK